MTPGPNRLLRAVRAFPGLHITRYAWVLDLTPGNLSRYADVLERAGLITSTRTAHRRHLHPSETT